MTRRTNKKKLKVERIKAKTKALIETVKSVWNKKMLKLK